MPNSQHVLYVDPVSAPCRAVLLHYAWLGEHAPDLEVKALQLREGGHKTDEFLALNPRHCVPTLVTPHGPLCESRAIMPYLAELTQHQDPDGWTAYPRTVFHRAHVHELLDWDQGTFYRAVSDVVYPEVFEGGKASEEAVAKLREVFGYLEEHVLGHGEAFLAGPRATVADASVAVGASMLDLVDCPIPGVPRVDAWRSRVAAQPGWAEVNVPFEQWRAALADKRESAKSDVTA